MTTRTLTLRDWEARAIQAGATVLLRAGKQPCAEFLARGVVSVVPQWPLQDGVRWFMADGCSELVPSPYRPGDLLRCRETWAVAYEYEKGTICVLRDSNDAYADKCRRVLYRATDKVPANAAITWRSPVTMPAWASRLTLRVKTVRAVRVAELTEADAKACGVRYQTTDGAGQKWYGVSESWSKTSAVGILKAVERQWTADYPRLPWDEAWAWALEIERSQ